MIDVYNRREVFIVCENIEIFSSFTSVLLLYSEKDHKFLVHAVVFGVIITVQKLAITLHW